MKKRLIFLFSILLIPKLTLAVTTSPGPLFTYEGVLTDTGGDPISTTQTVQLQILYSSDCAVFEESHSVTPGDSGEFSVIVGSGSRTDSTGNTADRIFAVSGSITCTSGSTINPTGYSPRSLRVRVGGVDLTPDVTINNVPFAINAARLSDKAAEDFVQINSTVTQASLEGLINIMPMLTPVAGQVLVAGADSKYRPATITAGTGIELTPGTNSLTISATGGGGGGISSISAGAPLNATTTSGVTTLGISQASSSSSGYLSSTDWNAFNSKLSSVTVADVPNLDWSKITSGKPTTLSGYGISDGISTTTTASGDLSGTFASPTVSKVQGRAYASTIPAQGQVYVWDESVGKFFPTYFGVSHLLSSSGTQQFPSSCSSSQTLTWSAVSDTFSCSNIANLSATAITSGTISSDRLPASATYWSAGLGGIHFSNGPVGLGTNDPKGHLHVVTPAENQSFIINKSTSSTASHAATFLGLRSRGTLASPNMPNADDILAEFMGSSEALSTSRAGMAVKASETHTASSKGMMLEFLVSPPNTTQGVRAFAIKENGNAALGNISGASIGTLPGISMLNTVKILEITGIGGTPSPATYSNGALLLTNNNGNEEYGDELGSILFGHRHGTYGLYAKIKADAEGSSDGNRGGSISFLTKGDGGTSTSTRMKITYDGKVGIGTSSPSALLHVAGAGTFDGVLTAQSLTQTSDRRFKDDIEVLPHSLEKILSLRGVSYRWKTDAFPERHFPEGKDIGLIAQEVESVFPEAIFTNADGYKSVSYSKLVSPLIESTKAVYGLCKANTEHLAEVHRKIAAVEQESSHKDLRIKSLEEENKRLKKDIELIKMKLGLR